MTFFARPNLEDTQFKQLSGSTLTLDGNIIINSVSGLSLSGDFGKIPIIVTGETNNYVLTYDDVDKVIKLKEPTASGGTGIYTCASPTTCTVGGLKSGSNIFNRKIEDILQDILVPTVTPTLTPNSFSMSILPTTTTYEVGCRIRLSACTTYNRGCVNPVYCGGPSVRTGNPTRYCYIREGISTGCTTSSLSNTFPFDCMPIQFGATRICARVAYSAGLPPKRSDGTSMTASTCQSGITSTCQRVIYGIYPYFWGKSTTPITINQTLVNNACTLGNRCLLSSSGDIVVTNYCAGGVGQPLEYIWVAIPATSPDRICFRGSNSPTNTGTIPGDLFSSGVTFNINSPSSCWNNVNYKFYISNYPTSTVTESGLNYCVTFVTDPNAGR